MYAGAGTAGGREWRPLFCDDGEQKVSVLQRKLIISYAVITKMQVMLQLDVIKPLWGAAWGPRQLAKHPLYRLCGAAAVYVIG